MKEDYYLSRNRSPSGAVPVGPKLDIIRHLGDVELPLLRKDRVRKRKVFVKVLKQGK